MMEFILKLEKLDLWESLLGSNSTFWLVKLRNLEQIQLAIRYGDGLKIYEFSNSKWVLMTHFEDLNDQNGFNNPSYSLHFKTLNPKQSRLETLICRTQNGFYFFNYDDRHKKFNQVAQDEIFSDICFWNNLKNVINWNNFYGSESTLGLFTSHFDLGPQLFIINPDGLMDPEEQIIWEDSENNKLIKRVFKDYKNLNFEFIQMNKNDPKTQIVCFKTDLIMIYEIKFINQTFKLTLTTELKFNFKKFWFANLNDYKLKNLIVLQNDALKVFNFNENSKTFHLISTETETFSESFGWQKDHTNSILFADLTDSGFDDMLYTGAYGLGCKRFNKVSLKWDTIELNDLGSIKYAIPFRFIPSKSSPTQKSVLILKQNNNLKFFDIKKLKILKKETSEHKEANNLDLMLNKKFTNKKVPETEPRVDLNNSKSSALLRDSINISSLLSSVNVLTGKISFCLPIFSLNSNLGLNLRYNGEKKDSSMLGIGWDIELEFITVDYQETVNKSQHKYYWVSNQRVLLLEPFSAEQSVVNYKLSTQYDLYLFDNLNEQQLPKIKSNFAIVLVKNSNNNFNCYEIQNGTWMRSNNNLLNKKVLSLKNINDLLKYKNTDGSISLNVNSMELVEKTLQICTSNNYLFILKIKYDMNNQTWEILSSDKQTRVYGGRNQSDSIAWMVGWKNWLSLGSDTENQLRYPIKWFLKEVKTKGFQVYKYNYLNNNQTTSLNTSFTISTYLNSIVDNFGTEIKLFYEKKPDFKQPILKDMEQNFLMVQSYDSYLKKARIESRVQYQTVEFNYRKTDKSDQELVSISQVEDQTGKPILEFFYSNDSNMTQVILPNRDLMKISYFQNEVNLDHKFNWAKNEFSKNEKYQLAFSNDFYVVVEPDQYDKNFDIDLYQENSSSIKHVLNLNEKATEYQLLAQNSFFGIIFQLENKKKLLYLFHKNIKNEWILNNPVQYSFRNEIKFGQDFICFINESNQICFLNWCSQISQFSSNFLSIPMTDKNTDIIILSNKDSILIYDNKNLSIAYKDSINFEWKIKHLKETESIVLQSKNTLEKFGLNNSLNEKILHALKVYSIQFNLNNISIFSWQEQNGYLYSNVKILILDSNLNISSEYSSQIKQEHINSIESEKNENEFIKGEKVNFSLKYNNFNVVFKNSEFYGPEFIESNKTYRRCYKFNQQYLTVTIQCKKEAVLYNDGKWLSSMFSDEKSETKSMKENIKDAFLIDLSKYFPSFVSFNKIKCGSKMICINGSKWIETEGSTDVVYITNDQYLKKESNVYKLYFKNNFLFNFETSSISNIQIGFPSYIAYKKNNQNSIFILPLNKESCGKEFKLIDNAELSVFSTPFVLVYKKNNKIFILPNPANLNEPIKDSVVNQLTLEVGKNIRSNSYEFDPKSASFFNGSLVYSKYMLIPGSNKSKYGYIKYDLNKPEKKQAYDMNGNKINIIETNPEYKESNEEKEELEKNETSSNTSLFIPNTRFEIAQFLNACPDEDEAGYLGFENYELEACKTKWKFNSGLIKTTGFSLTGENCLELKTVDDYLTAIFKPKNQNRSYQAACWLNLSNKQNYIKDFKAIIKTEDNKIIGELYPIIRITDCDWNYLEININLPNIKEYGAMGKYFTATLNNQAVILEENLMEPLFDPDLNINSNELKAENLINLCKENKISFYLWKISDSSSERLELISSNLANSKPVHILNSYKLILLNDISNSSISLKRRESIKNEVLSIELVLKPNKKNLTILLDNIRFTPLNQRFHARVYDPFTYQIKTLLDGNSGIKNLVYNLNRQQLASFNMDGNLNEFILTGKNGLMISFGTNLARSQPICLVNIKPTNGFYEEFSKYSFELKWSLENNEKNFRLSPGCLRHISNNSDSLQLDDIWLNDSSAGLYFKLKLTDTSVFNLIFFNNLLLISNNQINVNSELVTNNLPLLAEYLIIREENRLFIWINGQLQLDKSYGLNNKITSKLNFKFSGDCMLKDLIIFNNPSINFTYKNNLNEDIQQVELENKNSVLITQTIYDDLGRSCILTKKTRVCVSESEPLLAYHNNFVLNESNIFKTGLLEGKCNDLNSNDSGYCYSRTKYLSGLDKIKAIGKPGKNFGIDSDNLTEYNPNENQKSSSLEYLFPNNDGFTQTIEIDPNGTKHVKVVDSFGNRVAMYNCTIRNDENLTTYEYDENHNCIRILPPIFHSNEAIYTLKKKDTFTYLINYWTSKQNLLDILNNSATRMKYNEHGKIIERITPDTCKQILIYSQENLIRFIIQHDSNNNPKRIIFYDYNNWCEVNSQGYLDIDSYNLTELQTLANNYDSLPKSINYLQILSSDDSLSPILRGKTTTCLIKQSNDRVLKESFLYTSDENLILKNLELMDSNDLESNISLNIENSYSRDKLETIIYPSFGYNNNKLAIFYKRNKLGQIKSIGTTDDPEKFAKFDYNSQGQIASVKYSNFETKYNYNSPGYLTEIKNKYLDELIEYTRGGYGQEGNYDGNISKTQFKAKWFNNCDPSSIKFSSDKLAQRLKTLGHEISLEQAQHYLNCLQSAGYLDTNFRPIKQFYAKESPFYLPRECANGKIAYALEQILSEQFVSNYGHQYAYSYNMELTKAKYISGEDIKDIKPIQPKSFYEFSNGKITMEKSKYIWNLLSHHKYIWQDEDLVNIQGKVDSNSWIDFEKIKQDLNQFSTYYHLLAKILIKFYSKRELLDWLKFKDIFLNWLRFDTTLLLDQTIQNYTQVARELWNLLSSKFYFYSENNFYNCPLFKKDFLIVLKDYLVYLPEIVRALDENSNNKIGENACDVEAFSIDKNGNHKNYWTGYSRYELKYRDCSNQIESVNLSSISSYTLKNCKIEHDHLGNITKAEHKQIKKIYYNPVTNLTSLIEMENGNYIVFDYDSKGKRIRKTVYDDTNFKLKDVLYIRDNKGRSLVEKEFVYFKNHKNILEQETKFIYGPKNMGLIGFLRNNEFYSVISDHEGSIRLIIKNDQTVAAFDYMPYGSLIRQFGAYRDMINYRYTGQEWDEETGLYNYQARFYDPDLGRFYQIDPKEQYASPYKYAGNSPVSMVDPDGEFAILLVIGLGIVGGYLGGAAANKSWNPLKWDLKSANTYLGIFGGALAGALLPIGFSASLLALSTIMGAGAAIGVTCALGAGVAYLSMAATNNSFKFWKWNWTCPSTYSSMFQGFALGSGLIGAVGAWNKAFTGFTTAGKIAFGIGSGIGAIGFGYLGAAGANRSFNPANWNFKAPGTYLGLIGGAFGGFMAPVGLVGTYNFFQTLTGAKLYIGVGVLSVSVIGLPYLFLAAQNNSFNPKKWDYKCPQFYECLLGGVLFGISLPGLPRAFKEGLKFLKSFPSHFKNLQILRKFVSHLKNIIPHLKNLEEIQQFLQKNNIDLRLPQEGRAKLDLNRISKISIIELKDNTRIIGISGGDKNAGLVAYYKDGKFEIHLFKNNAIEAHQDLSQHMNGQKPEPWPWTNCAEVHAINHGLNSGLITVDNSIVSMTTVNRFDITPAARCRNCLVTTQATKNVTTDINIMHISPANVVLIFEFRLNQSIRFTYKIK